MSAHEGSHRPMAHTDDEHTRYWLTCSCGWVVDPAPDDREDWVRLAREHIATA